MHRVLLTLAASAAVLSISPAQGQSVGGAGFSASSGFRNIRFVSPPPPGGIVAAPSGRHRDFCRGEHCRHIRVADAVPAAYGYGGGGYYDYGDYDANRSFSPDKWNDWWHDRPDRAFPRWMSHNRDCARPWYAGDVLTC